MAILGCSHGNSSHVNFTSLKLYGSIPLSDAESALAMMHHHSFLAARHVVAQGAKLLSFQHQAVEVTQGKQDGPENGPGATLVAVGHGCPLWVMGAVWQ